MSGWQTLQIDFQAMASPCRLVLDGQDLQAMEHMARQCVREVHRIEYKYSRYRPDSVVSLINTAAGRDPVPIDAETSGLLEFANGLWSISDGLFDITSGVLRRAWDFKKGTPPEVSNVQRLLPLVGWDKVTRTHDQVSLPIAGMELDFGGFGKEYAADRAAVMLIEAGFTNALVNLGGDLHATGPRMAQGQEGRAWAIDIQHPRPSPASSSEKLISMELSRGGLATSGDYERFFIHDGQRYCHVLHPQTGWPVHAVQSVSVIAPSTTLAGAMTTIAMLQETQAKNWLLEQRVDFCLVDAMGQRTHQKSKSP